MAAARRPPPRGRTGIVGLERGSDLEAVRGAVSVVLPALNEATPLATFLAELVGVAQVHDWEVIVVDDGSSDGTSEVARGAGATVVRHERRRGYGAALKTGVRTATRRYVAFMDGDGQHAVSSMLDLLKLATTADMIVGARRSLRDSDVWRRPGKWVLNQLATYIAQESIPDLNSGLRVVDRDVLRRYIHLCPDGFSFTTTITLAFLDRGRTVRYVPIEVARPLTKSTVSVATGFQTLLLVLRLATLFQPLRLFVTASLLLMLAGFLWSIPYALEGHGISIGAALLVLSGVQLLFAGLLADQIATLRKERYE